MDPPSPDLVSSVTVDEIKIEPDEPEPEEGDEEQQRSNYGEDMKPDGGTPTEETVTFEITEFEAKQCEKCTRYFEGSRGVKNHLPTCNGDPNDPRFKFNCEICFVSFKYRNSLVGHMNKHEGIKPYKCQVQCDKRFFSTALRTCHEKKCRGVPQICPFCGDKLSNPGTLARHLNSQHSGERHECNVCGKVFDKNNKLVVHQRQMHSIEAPKYPCEVCGRVFREARLLQGHMGRHMEDKPFRCKLCNAGLSNRISLYMHMRYTHSEATLQCKTCGSMFKKGSELIHHRRKVHKEVLTEEKKILETSVGNIKPELDEADGSDSKEMFLAVTECETCHKFFDSKEGIASHVPSCQEPKESSDPLYACHICPVELKTPALLAAHLQEHKDGKLLQCRAECTKWFYDGQKRDEHEKGCRKWKWTCLICNAKLVNAQARSRHMNTVHVEPRHECEACGKKFSRKNNLNVHQRTMHSENAPKFPCEFCGRIFTQARKMRKHMEQQHVKPEPSWGAEVAGQ